MKALRRGRASAVAALASLVLLLSLVGPASAADPVFTQVFPAGWGCQGFDLQVQGYEGPGGSVYREFQDRNGNPVRVLYAGTGWQLTFTNLASGKSLSLRSNGAGSITEPSGSGPRTVTLLGHNVVFQFPTDIIAGPSTTLYIGRVVYTVDASETWTLVSAVGTKMDVCAAVS